MTPPLIDQAVKRNSKAIQPKLPHIFSSHFIVDFGCVTKGTPRTRKFKMTNPSTQALTLRFDKLLLEAWGFKIEPDSVKKLPEGAEVELALTLQANKAVVVQVGVLVGFLAWLRAPSTLAGYLRCIVEKLT